MRKYSVISVISLFLAVLIMMLLSGCSSNKGLTSQADGSHEQKEISGYPIVKDKPITLRYWLTLPANTGSYIKSSAENEVYIEMEKVTGIKVDYINPVGAVNEQFNLMIASGDIPDMIQEAGKYRGGISKGEEDGVFLDLTQLVPKYAPDYYRLIISREDIRRENTFDGGKIISFNRIKNEDDLPFRRLQTRTDWLDEAGMKEPKTIAEWETFLKFIAEKKNGVAPYYLINNGMEVNFMGAFNILPGFFLKEGKKVEYGQIQPEFKEYLTMMNRWYSYGYIPKDFTTIGDLKQIQLYGSSKAASFAGNIANAYLTAKASNIPQATAPFPRLKVGDKLHWYITDWTNTGSSTVVTKNSKYPVEAIRWLNYGYTEEGIILFNYGVKDRMWVMENGKLKYTDYALKNPKYPVEVISNIGKLHLAPMLSLPSKDCGVGGEDTMIVRAKWMDDKDVDHSYVVPPVRLTLEETDIRTSIMDEVNPYINQMVIKFITGAEPLSKFDEYVNQVKKFGIEDAIKVTQAAYERFMK